MKQIRFTIERVIGGVIADVAIVEPDEDPAESMLQQAWMDMQTEIPLTVNGVTMSAAQWADPAHWADDWAKKLEVEYDDAVDAVAVLLKNAVEEGK